MEIFLGEGSDEFLERGKDLNEELIKNKTTTFFYRMKGDSMTGVGIHDRDLLIVDRALKANSGKVIIAVFNGEVIVRRFLKNFNSTFLLPENNNYKQNDLAELSDFVVLGVVTYVIHQIH